MSSQSVNPYEIVQHRRKLKLWKKTTPIECMKILKKVRELNIDNKMLIATEFPRTLIYVANRTRESKDEDIKKMNKMCRYLAKEWRKQLGVADKKEDGGQKNQQKEQKAHEGQEKIVEEKGDKLQA